jgi:molybdenum cofactor biosynthesis enzyme MoaA
MKPTLEFIESFIINPCNLSCVGCTTFSDLETQGYSKWEDEKHWFEKWSKRIDFQSWGVMGGEPFMNPYLRDWIIGIRNLLPGTQIRIVTNGTLLDKHWDIINLLSEIGNCILKISVHIDDAQINNIL